MSNLQPEGACHVLYTFNRTGTICHQSFNVCRIHPPFPLEISLRANQLILYQPIYIIIQFSGKEVWKIQKGI